jgi:Ca2+-binding EF-hand superfamily protein
VKTAFKMFDEDGNGVLEEHEFLGRSLKPGGSVP